MTNFDKIKSMSIDELAKFIDEHAMYDDTPWMDWWDKNYCDKCEYVTVKFDDQEKVLGFCSYRDNIECAYCEVYNKCRYFPDLEEEPSMQDIIKMWLEAEND